MDTLIRLTLCSVLVLALVGCLPSAKRAEIEARIQRLQDQTLAITEGIKAGKIPVAEGMALIQTVSAELDATKKDLDALASAPWYTKLDGLLTLVLGAGSLFGLPTAWIQRVRAIRNSKIAEAVIQGVEAYGTANDGAKALKGEIETAMGRLDVASHGHALVKSVTQPAG